MNNTEIRSLKSNVEYAVYDRKNDMIHIIYKPESFINNDDLCFAYNEFDETFVSLDEKYFMLLGEI